MSERDGGEELRLWPGGESRKVMIVCWKFGLSFHRPFKFEMRNTIQHHHDKDFFCPLPVRAVM